jgi:hypothetical protein
MSASNKNHNYNNPASSESQLLLEEAFAKLHSNPDEILLLDGGTGEEVSNNGYTKLLCAFVCLFVCLWSFILAQ